MVHIFFVFLALKLVGNITTHSTGGRAGEEGVGTRRRIFWILRRQLYYILCFSQDIPQYSIERIAGALDKILACKSTETLTLTQFKGN